VVLAAAVGDWAPPAAAAPAAPTACPESIQDRYEPGDQVTVVGYTQGCVPDVGELARNSRPLKGYLHADPCGRTTVPCVSHLAELEAPTDGLPIGRLTVEQGEHPPRGLRMSLTFTLPDDLAAGTYFVVVCQDPCPPGLNYGRPQPLYVGVDPPESGGTIRAWPLDDPAIADLPDDAIVLGPDGHGVTAADVRAGNVSPSTTTATADTTAGSGGDSGSDRVETAAAPPDDHGSKGDHTLLLWAGGLAALLVGWRLVARRGAGVKQIRRPRSRP
jgi:hypothetical protein